MSPLPNVYALTDFRARTSAHLKRLKKTDRPTLLTQNGKTAAVVLSEAQYEKLLADAELGRSIAAIREALDDPRPAVPWSEASKHLRALAAGGGGAASGIGPTSRRRRKAS